MASSLRLAGAVQGVFHVEAAGEGKQRPCQGEGGLGETGGSRAARGEEALVELQRDPGDVAPFPRCLGEVGFEDRAEGSLGLLDLEGEDVGGGDRLGAVDVGEESWLASDRAVEGEELSLRGEG